MFTRVKIPPVAVVNVNDPDLGCPTGQKAVNVVMLDLDALGYTLLNDRDSPIVPYVDADGCVKGWVLKVVPAEAP